MSKFKKVLSQAEKGEDRIPVVAGSSTGVKGFMNDYRDLTTARFQLTVIVVRELITLVCVLSINQQAL